MKIIYKFKLEQEKEVEELVTKRDDTGKEFKVPEKVKKLSARSFVLKRPTRNLYDDAEVYYASQVSELIKKGVLSAVQLNKRYLNDGGILSDEQKKEYATLYTEVAIKKSEYDKINNIPEAERKDEEKEKLKSLLDDLVFLMDKIQRVENAKDTVLNNTAEIIARDRTVRWWMLYLSYEEIDENNYKPIFAGNTLEEKTATYNAMDEKQDDFEYDLVERLYLATGLWYMGKAATQNDFDIMIKVDEHQSLLQNKELIENIEKENKESVTPEVPKV